MGYRLSKIYTRTGDRGKTGLADGKRVDKFDALIEACGAVDETNSVVGLLLAEPEIEAEIREELTEIQHQLFEAGAELSCPGYRGLSQAEVETLEHAIDRRNRILPPLKEFVLPGGNRPAAICHLARATCRRAERATWAAARDRELGEALLSYLNRLSDYFFVLARTLSRLNGNEETLWNKQTPARDSS